MKVLMVGLGAIGQRHLRNLRTLLGEELQVDAYRVRRLRHVVTEQLSVETGSDVEGKFRVRVHTELWQALEQRPDAVFVCNPTSAHLPVAREAALANCPLFIEKPLSNSWEGVEELIALTDARQLVALVAYQMRFHPCLQRLRALLQQKVIGAVLAVRVEVGEYLPDWHPYEDYRRSYAARSDLGGGVLLTLVHELDYVYWLFGVPRKVFAVGGHLSSLEVDVEDVASVLLECVADDRSIPVHVHLDFVQRPPTRTCTVLGDAGRILVDFRALTVCVLGGRGQVIEQQHFAGFQRNQLFVDELTHFLACLKGEQLPVVTVRDGARSLRMALAARESMETGRLVELPASGLPTS